MFIFFKRIYSQNDEAGVLEALENKTSLAAQTLWGDPYRIL